MHTAVESIAMWSVACSLLLIPSPPYPQGHKKIELRLWIVCGEAEFWAGYLSEIWRWIIPWHSSTSRNIPGIHAVRLKTRTKLDLQNKRPTWCVPVSVRLSGWSIQHCEHGFFCRFVALELTVPTLSWGQRSTTIVAKVRWMILWQRFAVNVIMMMYSIRYYSCTVLFVAQNTPTHQVPGAWFVPGSFLNECCTYS